MYNFEKMKEATQLMMEAVGVQNDEHSEETPDRVAKMGEVLYQTDKDPKDYIKLFPKGSQEVVMQKEIPFYSFCAHHHLPFYGKAAIMYAPNETNIGLSKLARITRHFSKGFTTQEQLTKDVAEFIYSSDLKPKGVVVIIDSTHTCMTIRGVRAPGVQTRTKEVQGEINPETLNQFWLYVGNPSSFGY